jgi:hypothetical protein
MESSETKEYTACFPCSVGLYGECMNLQPIEGDLDHFLPCYNKQVATVTESSTRGPGRPVKELGEDGDTPKRILDRGRKRAAMLYPLVEGMVCQWAGLRYAGGGVETIIGCRGNVLEAGQNRHARHHGPNKSVVFNDQGNVHLICPTCHNRWHTLNDPYYGERPDAGKPFVPVGYDMLEHDPTTQATDQEITENEKWWQTAPTKRLDNEDE